MYIACMLSAKESGTTDAEKKTKYTYLFKPSTDASNKAKAKDTDEKSRHEINI